MQSERRPDRRFAEFRASETCITGVLLRYGDTARFGTFTERFEPGALKMDADLIANLMHDRMRPVARTGAGLTVTDDGSTVEARIEWPETVYAREARELVQAGVLKGLSVEFRAAKSRFEGRERVITEARMTGLGIVDRPAYPASVIASRMWDEWAPMRRAQRRRFAL